MHPIFILLGAILVVIPFWMILPRAGLSSFWALLSFVPFGAVVLLWVLALKRWPGDTVGGGT